MTPTPGAYLRLRRVAAGRSIEEVALETATTPEVCARDRADLIAAIEADRVPISRDIVLALHEVYAFDRMILVQLVAIHAGADVIAPDLCVTCGCSWDDPCRDELGHGCAWADPARTLCTACAGGAVAAIAMPDLSAAPPPAATGITVAAALAANFDRPARWFGYDAGRELR